jgi:hypothetical protein
MYLDENLWSALHAQARMHGTTVSDLVRQAVRDRYLGKLDERRDAMQAFVGIRKDRSDIPDAEATVRALRRGSRIERLAKK